MEILNKEILFILINLVTNLVTLLSIKEFKCPKKYHLISFILSTILIFTLKEYTLHSALFLIVFQLLLIGSFIDMAHYEFSNIYYILLFLPCTIKFIASTAIIESFLSIFAVYITFWIFDKFVGIEMLGGADVKIIIIMSFFFIASDVLLFILNIFILSAIMFIIEKFVKKTFCDLQVPMVDAILISFFSVNFELYCNNFITFF